MKCRSVTKYGALSYPNSCVVTVSSCKGFLRLFVRRDSCHNSADIPSMSDRILTGTISAVVHRLMVHPDIPTAGPAFDPS